MSTTIDDLCDYNVTFTMTAGAKRRTFTITIPAPDSSAARMAAHGLAWAVNEGSGHVWKTTDEITVEAA